MDYKERIRALREDNDYTQSRIAGLLNIGQNTYADYELGKTRIPVDSLIKLAQFYDVDMNYITDISKTVHKFPKEKQQLAAVNKRKKIVIPEHTLHCCQFYPIQLSKLNSLDSKFRIHPARIEELYKKAEDLVNERVREAGEQAAFDAGIHDLHPEIVKTLGALKYRTSFGQNVLSHSIQVSALCGIMASELGLDPAPAKRAGLLHDIGKAIDHEVEGPHAVIGADLARRYGERSEIVHAIEAHHADVDPDTVLDVLVQAADAISAARPGARRESAETYIKRLEKLEEISNAHEGVERTYAMQAGRELHVMVEPEKISDAQATVLAHDIAKQIEDEMEYPGQVRVVVIRESRAVDVAK